MEYRYLGKVGRQDFDDTLALNSESFPLPTVRRSVGAKLLLLVALFPWTAVAVYLLKHFCH